MAAEETFDLALQRAYRYLGMRDRTVAEVRKHLVAKGVAEALAEEVVDELGEQGYLDDARFAQRFTEDRRRLDSWGADRIEQRLLALGVPRELIGPAVAQGAEAELDTAVELLRRRFPAPPASGRDRDRALGMLVRRGYDLELAYDAVRALGREAA
jgi:regulatory protein